MMNSFLKKTSWMALAIALVCGGVSMAYAGTKTSDSSTSEDASQKAANKKADQKAKQEIAKKIAQRLKVDMEADAKLLKACPNCQAKYILNMPGIGQVGGLEYKKREDLRGGNQCKEEVYKALKKESGPHVCFGNEYRFDPANMATGIYNLDADVDVEHDMEYSVLDLTRTCAMMGKDGKSGSSAGEACCEAWESALNLEETTPIRFWMGEIASTKLIMQKFCCNLNKRELVRDNEKAEEILVGTSQYEQGQIDMFCQTESQEKAQCVKDAVSGGSSTEEAWKTCDVECDQDYADLFHDSEGVDSDKTEAERNKEIDAAIKECYEAGWAPSKTCLTASELSPITPTGVASLIYKELKDDEKGTGKKEGEVTQAIIADMLVTPNATVNANQGSKDTTNATKASAAQDDTKAYQNNINSARENQNKIKINAATRAIALGKRAVWLATTAGEDVEKMGKKLEKADDFMTMFKAMAELQAQHLQKTTQNTALRAKLSELTSIEGIVSGNIVTSNEKALENEGKSSSSDEED